MKNSKIVIKIIKYIDTILDYTNNVDYQSFSSHSMLIEACVFNLSQMGELVNKLDDAFIEKNQHIPWHKIRGLRNRIVHDYEGVKMILIWEIVSSDLPNLKNDLEELIKKQ